MSTPPSPARPVVLFLCVRNAGRSQMAAAFARVLSGGRLEVRSAGSAPATEVHPEVRAAMAEVGVDLSGIVPARVTDDDARVADVVVSMGCGDACPVLPGRRTEDWSVDDPHGRPLADVRRIRDEIRRRVEGLLVSLGVEPAAPGPGTPGDRFARSLASGAHARLARLVGSWRGTSRLWLEPGVLTEESPIEGTFRSILGGRFVLHEYRTQIGGQAVEGVAIHGYELTAERFVTAWVDSWHNGTNLMTSVGPRTPPSGPMAVLGHYADPGGGPDWGWRTTLEMPGPDEVVLEHWNLTPTGEAAKAVEVRYRRA